MNHPSTSPEPTPRQSLDWPSLWPASIPPHPTPLWEEIHPQTAEQLIGFVAGEIWQRTRGPTFAARIAEAEADHIVAGGSWQSYLAIESAYHDEADARTDQAALVGLFLARGVDDCGDDPERWCQVAMHRAGLAPLSFIARIICEARVDAANRRRRHHQSNDTQGVTR